MGRTPTIHLPLGRISLLDWSGLVVSLGVVVGVTVYFLFSSFSTPKNILNSAPQEPLALVAVAIANNVGTGISRTNEIPVISPNDIAMAEDSVVQNGMDTQIFLSDTFQQLSEYTEIAGIDVSTYLKGKPNKQDALEVYTDELTLHTEKAKQSLQKAQAQVLFHKNALQNVQNDIKNTQDKIETAYTDRNSTAITDAIADLDELTLIQQDHKYGQIFAQQIVKEYQSLIDFSEKKLEVIQANMPALTQEVVVRLPEGNTLKDLEQLHIFSRDSF